MQCVMLTAQQMSISVSTCGIKYAAMVDVKLKYISYCRTANCTKVEACTHMYCINITKYLKYLVLRLNRQIARFFHTKVPYSSNSNFISLLT